MECSIIQFLHMQNTSSIFFRKGDHKIILAVPVYVFKIFQQGGDQPVLHGDALIAYPF